MACGCRSVRAAGSVEAPSRSGSAGCARLVSTASSAAVVTTVLTVTGRARCGRRALMRTPRSRAAAGAAGCVGCHGGAGEGLGGAGGGGADHRCQGRGAGDRECEDAGDRRDVTPVDPDRAALLDRGAARGVPAGRREHRPGGGDRGPDHPRRAAAGAVGVADVHAERVGEGALDDHPPGRTQLPPVTAGWSTAAGAASRPSTTTRTVVAPAVSARSATGNSPLWAVTPAAVASGASAVRASGPGDARLRRSPAPDPEQRAKLDDLRELSSGSHSHGREKPIVKRAGPSRAVERRSTRSQEDPSRSEAV